MRMVRILLRILALAVAAAVVGSLVVFVLLSVKPADYRWRHLSPEEQEDQMYAFNKHVLTEFGNGCGEGKPFTWTLTADQANRYLASVDAIASFWHKDPVHPSEQMDRAGLCDPAVSMNDGVLTLMTRARKAEKILSVDLAFVYNDDGEIAARIRGVRMGVMPVPKNLVADHIARGQARLARMLAKMEKAPRAPSGPVPLDRLASLLGSLVGMMDGGFIRPELVWPIGRHRVRIERVTIGDGQLTLHVVPVKTGRRTKASGPLRAAGD